MCDCDIEKMDMPLSWRQKYRESSFELNDYLRTDNIPSNSNAEYFAGFQKGLMDELEVIPPIAPICRQPLYRGTWLLKSDWENLKEEKIYIDKAFLSTCMIKGCAIIFSTPYCKREEEKRNEDNYVRVLFEIRDYTSAYFINNENEGYECLFFPETKFEYVEHKEVEYEGESLLYVVLKQAALPPE